MSIVSNYEDKKKLVRKYIYEVFVSKSHPPTLEMISANFNIKREEAISLLQSLFEDRLIVIDPKINKIMIAHPFAGISTGFEINTLSGVKYFATCAWDAVAMHFTLEEDIGIAAYCYFCNSRISISISNEGFASKTPESTLTHFQKSASEWWDDIIDTCYNTMNFFCSQKHLDDWIKLNPSKTGYTLTDSQILAISKLLYKGKTELNYLRPTLQQINECFVSNNLTGYFWKL